MMDGLSPYILYLVGFTRIYSDLVWFFGPCGPAQGQFSLVPAKGGFSFAWRFGFRGGRGEARSPAAMPRRPGRALLPAPCWAGPRGLQTVKEHALARLTVDILPRFSGTARDYFAAGFRQSNLRMAVQYSSLICTPPCSGLGMSLRFLESTTKSRYSKGIWPSRLGTFSPTSTTLKSP